MEQLKQALNWAIGLELENEDINILQMSLRAVIVFIIAIILLRIGNKRFMGKSTALDVLLGIIFGSMVSRAITGNAPFVPALVAAAALLAMHWLFSALAFRSHLFGKAIKGEPRVLVRDGAPDREALTAAIVAGFAGLSAAEVAARLDAAGIANARVNDMRGLWAHPQLRARDRWREVDTPAGPVPALLPPAGTDAFAARMGAVPALGEHSRAILGELGYDEGAIARLVESGTV